MSATTETASRVTPTLLHQPHGFEGLLPIGVKLIATTRSSRKVNIPYQGSLIWMPLVVPMPYWRPLARILSPTSMNSAGSIQYAPTGQGTRA